MKFFKIIQIVVFCITCSWTYAQDIHFSQFNSSPLNINPALTGLFNSDYRIIGNYRSQWSSVTVPFITYSASADMNIRVNRQRDVIGIGMLFNGDKAGDSEYGTMQFCPTLSYTKALSNSDLYITYGMQAGIVQKSFNASKLTFDDQYSNGSFNANTSSGEAFNQTSMTYFDAAAGVDMFYEADERYNVNGGVAIHHLNQPVYSFNNNSKLQPRFTVHANSSVRLVEKIYLLPGIIMLRQAGSSEYTIGSHVKFSPRATEQLAWAVYLGGFMRLRDYDAFIASTRLDYNNISIGVSYDINTSQLKTASNMQGGLEISIIYLIKNFSPVKYTKKIPCPIFI